MNFTDSYRNKIGDKRGKNHRHSGKDHFETGFRKIQSRQEKTDQLQHGEAIGKETLVT